MTSKLHEDGVDGGFLPWRSRGKYWGATGALTADERGPPQIFAGIFIKQSEDPGHGSKENSNDGEYVK